MNGVAFASKSDLPALVELGRQMHVESRYGWMVYSAERTWKRADEMLDRKDRCVLVAGAGGELHGFLVAAVVEYPFAHAFMANIEFIYVMPSHRGGLTAMKLMTAFRRWATNREVVEIALNNRFGSNDAYLSKWLSKVGLPLVGGAHAAWLEQRP